MNMGKYFSDAVDNAIEAIYYTYDREKAAAAVQPLADAANAGDGDAAYILSRCVSGPQYSWDYHPFQANDEAVEQLIRQSIVQGSAMGVLGAMRCGMLTPEMEEAMPFANLREAWNAVYEKAQAGCLFAMNMIGSSYYWLDILRIEEKKAGDFPSQEEFDAYLRENILKSAPWFERAFRGGMGVAGRNWYNLYHQGQEGLLPPDRKKAEGSPGWAPNWVIPTGRRCMATGSRTSRAGGNRRRSCSGPPPDRASSALGFTWGCSITRGNLFPRTG